MINYYYYKKQKQKLTLTRGGCSFLQKVEQKVATSTIQEYELVQYGGGNTDCKTKNRVAVQMSGVKFWHIG